jgi:Cof subfamily protein (haloacid dehalogenase superfamily)
MIQLIAIDLDGTLFNSQQQITANSKKAIQRIRSEGIKTAIVTGRGKAGALMALDMLGMDMPFICSAGSLVCSGKDDQVISARTFIIKEELHRIVNFAREHNSGLIADSLEGNWWFGPDELGESLDPMTAVYAWKSRRTLEPEVDFQRPMLKITLIADPDILSMAERQLCGQCPSLHHVYAGMRYIDLTSKEVNKGTALEILANYLGVMSNEIAAIGDQMIDYSMLTYAGLPIAMENAPDELKKTAKWIAPSHDADGVASVLGRILSERT